MKNLAILSFLVFLSFLSVNALAYTEFTNNSYFESNNSNIKAYFIPTGGNGTLYNMTWNNTCSGLSGCVYYANQSGSLDITPSQTFFLPANEELLVVFSYRLNETLTTPAPYFVIDGLSNSSNQTNINATPNVWYNYSLFYDSATSDRYISVGLIFNLDAVETTIFLDELKLYTLDIIEGRTVWTTNQSYEAIRYCGINATSCTDKNCFENTSLNGNAYLICKDINAIRVAVVKIGNSTISRRVISYTSFDSFTCGGWSGNSEGMEILRDGILIHGGTNCNTGAGAFIESLSLTSIKFTPINNFTYASWQGIQFSGTPFSYMNYSYPSNNALLTTYNDTNNNRISVSTLPFINSSTPSGTQWKFCYLALNPGTCSQLKNFFSYDPFNCVIKHIYDPITDYSYYQNSNCSLTDYHYCGACGGNITTGLCNNEESSTNAICTSSTNWQITSFNNGTCQFLNSTGSCGANEICVNQSNSISCFNTESENYTTCVDINNNVIPCSSNLNNLCLTEGAWIPCSIIDNTINSIDAWNFGLYAMKFLIGLVIIFSVLITINYYYSKNTGDQLDLALNILLFIFLLALFTFGIKLIDSFIFISLLIVAIVLLAGKIKGAVT